MSQSFSTKLTNNFEAFQILEQFKNSRANSIQLYAGSCILSPLVRKALNNDMGLMPAMGDPFAKQQPGMDEISALEQLVSKQLNKLFASNWAESRLQSCTYANAVVFEAFSKPGDLIASISIADGGHISHQANGTLSVLQRRHLPLIFSGGLYDDEKSAEQIIKFKPSIVILGASVMLDEYTLDNTIAAARSCNATLVYDASHVMGLIAAGLYQSPLDLGFDILTGSTYKTLCAPAGGLILGNNPEHFKHIKQKLVGGWISNYDASRLAGLSVALDEARFFMKDFMMKSVNNAQYLFTALKKHGVPVINSGSGQIAQGVSHQILISTDNPSSAQDLSKRAQECGILSGTARVPSKPNLGAIRLGTHVITRQGIDNSGLNKLALALSEIYKRQENQTTRHNIQSLANQLTNCLYCFN